MLHMPRTYDQLTRDERDFADRIVAFTDGILKDWRFVLRVQAKSRLEYVGQPIQYALWVVDFRHEDNHEIRGGLSLQFDPREFENPDYRAYQFHQGVITWAELVQRNRTKDDQP